MTFENLSLIPLVYPDISGINQYTNILLIDNTVADYQVFIDSISASTFPIVYSTGSTKSDVLTFLQTYFTTIPRIGICFTSSSGGPKMFLDNEPFFIDDEIVPYTANMQFILDIITKFQVKNIDYLACDTLNYPNWKNYYDVLMNSTGVIVGASSDKTGNIKYGGDWVLESTSQDVEFVYFTQNIEYYTYLLDTLSWVININGGIGIAFYNDYLYHCIYNTNKIVKIDPNTREMTTWFSIAGVLSGCWGIIYYNGYFYVSSSSRITRIKADDPNEYFSDWANLGVLVHEMAVYNNDLYVVCDFRNIVRINITTRTMYTFTTQNFDSVRGIVYYNGYFYTTNAGKIVRIDTAGNSTNNWATTQGISNDAIVVYGNYLYVSNRITNVIIVINIDNPTTEYYSPWLTGITNSRAMSLYNNNLYVSNFSIGAISKITSLANWATPSSALNKRQGITLYNGYFYVTNFANNTIAKINVNNTSDYSILATGGLNGPCGIVYYNGYFYVCNYSTGTINSTITRIDANNPGTYVAPWANNATQGLYGSYGLTVYDGYLYVCNLDNNTITKINTAYATAETFATSASGLFGPRSIVYYNNNFYVSNTGKIVKIDMAGGSTDNWATTTQGLDAGPTVYGLAVYDNCLYVSNFMTNKIVIINIDNPTTQYNTAWPVSLNRFNGPREMYVYNDNLYVCNYGNNTISQIPLEKGFFWFTLGGASGLTINGNYLYVSNYEGGQITKIDINDPTKYVLDWVIISGSYIRGLANDGTYIYAPDTINYQINRILISDPTQIDIGWAKTAQGVGECRQLHVNGNYLYTTNYNTGNISKISLVDPTGTDTVPIWKTSFAYQGITSDNNYIYTGADSIIDNISRVSLTDPMNSISGDGGDKRGCVVFDNILYFTVQETGGLYTISLNNRGVTMFKGNFANYYEQIVVSYPYIFSSNIVSGYISRFTLPPVLISVIIGNGYIKGKGFIIENS